ncbi:hypothetical protein BT96DRAFT_834837, partial [Gymnopus androsaceus JB14]
QCVPTVEFDLEQGQHVLEHNGAHLLHNSTIDRSTEPCGLCLRPSSLCRIYLKKNCGRKSNFQINLRKSKCTNLAKFSYKTATTSSKTSPCSNVPLLCDLCGGIGAAAVWRYNMKHHLMNVHPTVDLVQYQHLWVLSMVEVDGMQELWRNRKKSKRKKAKALTKDLPAFRVSVSQISLFHYILSMTYFILLS